MAISYVGGVKGGRAGSTSTTTQSLSGTLTGGSASSPSPGDLVVVWCSVGTASSYVASSQTISGNNNGAYSYETFQSQADNNYSQSQLNYKIQGATVDTSLTIPSSGNARNAQRWVVHVFRGVRGASPLDVTSVPSSGANTGRPDPASITPSTAGAWICAYYASAAATGAAYTAPSGLSGWLGGTSSDTYDCMQGGGYYSSWTSGAYNPQAITAGGTTGSGDAWTAMTIALRPELAPTVALGTPADNASISDTTPDLKFTGTDGDGDDIRYNVQVDTVNTFDSQTPTYSFGPEGFESGTRGAFDSDYTNNGSVSYDSSSKITGTYSAKFTTTAAGSATVQETVTGTSELYILIKVFIPTAFSWGTATYAGLISFIGASTTTALNFEDWGTLRLAIYDDTAGYAETGIDISKNSVHTIQLRVKRGSGTGVIQMWIDNSTEGSPDYSATGLTTGTDNITNVRVGNAYSDAAITDIYIDDVIINSSFISGAGGGPLIDVVSGTVPGFSGSPDNTDPFASAQAVTYTVQSALSDGTYYWRVRGIDPSGGNTWGAWSPGDSTLGYDHFHLSSGPVNGSVTQVGASLTLTGGTQVVEGIILANASVTQTGASLTLSGGTQTVASIQTAAVTQTAASMTLSGGTQSVASAQIASVTQTAASLTLTSGTQAVASTQIGAITQIATSLTLSTGTQSVSSVQTSAITQTAASLTLSGGTQSVTAVVAQNASVAQTGASLVLSGGTQEVAGVIVASASVTQVGVSLALSTGTQAVNSTQVGSVTQTAASLTLTGGTQAVEGIEGNPVENASVTQTGVSMTLSTGTQVIEAVSISNGSVTQVGASLTLSGGTQQVASSQVASISQVGASLTLSGGTQTVASVGIASISQTGVALTLTGGTQSVISQTSASITQVGASLVLSGGTQSITTIENAVVQQIAAQLSLSGGTQQVVSVATGAVTQVGANLVLTTGTQVISTATGPLPTYYPDMIFCDGNLAIQLDEDQYIKI